MIKKSKRTYSNQMQKRNALKFVYVTRHFNHSGFLILKKLIDLDVKPIAVILEKKEDPYLNRIIRPFAIIWYYLKCWFYRCPPIKTLTSEELLAKAHSIPIIKIKTMRDDKFVRTLSNIEPDLMVLGGGWHELIPEVVFQMPKLGCINTHPSLLPEFRGTSITRWQRLYGVHKSGVSIHYVNENFDTGEIIMQKSINVSPNISPQELFRQLGNLGAEMIPDLLVRFSNEGHLPIINIENNSQYYRYFRRWKWDSENLKIDFSKPLSDIHYFISANTQESYQYLGPICRINGMEYLIRESGLIDFSPEFPQETRSYNSDVGIVFIKNGYLYLYRENEEYFLEIRRIQKYDRFFKFRRSNTPDKFLKNNKPVEIEAL